MKEVLETILKGIIKLVWKTFLITLWGTCKLLESILHAINELLNNAIK